MHTDYMAILWAFFQERNISSTNFYTGAVCFVITFDELQINRYINKTTVT